MEKEQLLPHGLGALDELKMTLFLVGLIASGVLELCGFECLDGFGEGDLVAME